MLHQVLNQALVAVNADAGSLMLVDDKQKILQVKARLGKPQPRRKIERVFKIDDTSVAGWVVQNKQPYLCPDIDNDPFFVPSRSGKNFFSLLSVPILLKSSELPPILSSLVYLDFTTSDKANLQIHRLIEAIKS
jgi:GAF domain-containing protein